MRTLAVSRFTRFPIFFPGLLQNFTPPLTQRLLLKTIQTNKGSAAERKSDRSQLHRRYHFELWLMLTPFLLGVSLLVILPLLATVGLAFSEFDALSPPTWKGLGNFSEIFQRDLFWIAARNSLLFVLLAVPLRVGGALLLALFFNHRRRAVALYRSAVYLPTIIPDVAYALICCSLCVNVGRYMP